MLETRDVSFYSLGPRPALHGQGCVLFFIRPCMMIRPSNTQPQGTSRVWYAHFSCTLGAKSLDDESLCDMLEQVILVWGIEAFAKSNYG